MKKLILLLALDTAFAGQRMPTWDEIQSHSHRAVPKLQEPPCDTPEPSTIAVVGVSLAAIAAYRGRSKQ